LSGSFAQETYNWKSPLMSMRVGDPHEMLFLGVLQVKIRETKRRVFNSATWRHSTFR